LAVAVVAVVPVMRTTAATDRALVVLVREEPEVLLVVA